MSRNAKPPLRLQLETVLECPADAAWDQERKVSHLLSISRPLIVFRLMDLSPAAGLWHLGRVIELRGYVFGLVPLGRHRVEVVRLDPDGREIETEEGGGLIRSWRHRVTIRPMVPGRCRYQDDILIDAGVLTRPLWVLACLAYRLRQRRWRGLARRLAAPSESSVANS